MTNPPTGTLWGLGINHTSAPISVRERLAFTAEQLGPALHTLRQAHPQPVEATLLSTCNRTEIYCAGPKEHAVETLWWLARTSGLSMTEIQSHTYNLTDAQVARHVFRVASGLDSMVLGEPQILGQMKAAVRAADEGGLLGTLLHQLFQRAFAIAKDVRTSTEIGEHSISMAAAAVRLAGQLFEDLQNIHVLFVGAGEMIELAATHFAAQTPKSLAIANRSLERGEKLASRFGGEVMRLAELPQRLHEFDVVVSCTASTLPLIGLGAVERAIKQRKHRPMLMVDLAVPRDIEPEVRTLEDVYLYSIDDLAKLVQTAHAHRQSAVTQAEVIVDAGVQSFMHWMDYRQSVPLIHQLQSQANTWSELEIQRARRLLAKGASPEQALQALAQGLTQKFLHGPLAELHAGDANSRAQTAQTIAQLFLRSTRDS